MKKIVLCALFCIAAMGAATAQGDLGLGFQLSPTFSWLNSDNNEVNGNGTNLGLKLGVIGEYYFAENYAFSTGIGFAFNQGGTLLYEEAGKFWTKSELPLVVDTLATLPKGTNLKYNIQFVEIPLGLKMRTREFGYFRFYAEPLLLLGFKAKAVGTLNVTGMEKIEDIDIKKEVNGLAVSWGFGAGTEYGVSANTSIIGGIQYQRIFTDITDNNGFVIDEDRNNEQRDNDSKGIGNALVIKLGVRF